MTDHERKVLAEIAEPGSQKDLSWGAAMGAALEFLRASGYVTTGPTPRITAKGREALNVSIA